MKLNEISREQYEKIQEEINKEVKKLEVVKELNSKKEKKYKENIKELKEKANNFKCYVCEGTGMQSVFCCGSGHPETREEWYEEHRCGNCDGTGFRKANIS